MVGENTVKYYKIRCFQKFIEIRCNKLFKSMKKDGDYYFDSNQNDNNPF